MAHGKRSELQRISIHAGSFSDLFEILPDTFDISVVVDASAQPNFVHIVEAFRCRSMCLFDGRPGEELADVAPYIVHLERAYDDAHDYLWECFFDGNAILLGTNLPPASLKRHLKRFLRRTIDGKEHYVKFYTANNFIFLFEQYSGFERFFSDIDYVGCANLSSGSGVEVISREVLP